MGGESLNSQILRDGGKRFGRKTGRKKFSSKWSENEYSSLIHLVRSQGEDWSRIASRLPAKTAKQCMQKFKNSQRSAKKGNWTNDEDEILLAWVHANGATKWTECSKQIKGRCGKQCRERWVNILNPDVKKGNWTDEEQVLIFESLHKYFTSWSAMSKVLPGRTENSIKNYFYSSVRRLKSNCLTRLLREIHLNRKDASSKLLDYRTKFAQEICKLNKLSQEICKFLMEPSNAVTPFKQFIISLLFSDEQAESLSPYPALAEPSQPVARAEVAPPPAHKLSSAESYAAFELVRRYLEKTGNSTEVYRLFEQLREQMEAREEGGEVRTLSLKLPACWHCEKEPHSPLLARDKAALMH